jgi:hypothetical protein
MRKTNNTAINLECSCCDISIDLGLGGADWNSGYTDGLYCFSLTLQQNSMILLRIDLSASFLILFTHCAIHRYIIR